AAYHLEFDEWHIDAQNLKFPDMHLAWFDSHRFSPPRFFVSPLPIDLYGRMGWGDLLDFADEQISRFNDLLIGNPFEVEPLVYFPFQVIRRGGCTQRDCARIGFFLRLEFVDPLRELACADDE